MLRRASSSEAREEFSEIINRVAYGGEQVVICRRGSLAPLVAPTSATAPNLRWRSDARAYNLDSLDVF